MKHHSIAISVAVALSLSIQNVASSDNDQRLVVTANKIQQDVNDTLAVIEIISREDIEQLRPQSVTELFETIAGLDVTNNGGHGQSSSFFSRGTNSSHTLILIDGVRVGSATLGNKELNSLPVAQIERIEIVKGPRAALWGSDAIGGVVQIFTRRMQQGQYQASATLGSNQAQHGNLIVGLGGESVSNTISIASEKSDGYDVLDSETDNDRDGYRKISLALRGDFNIDHNHLLDWIASADEGNNEFDTLWSGGTVESDYKNQLWNLRYSYSNENWLSQIAAKGSRDYLTQYGNGTLKGHGGIFETRRQQINALLQHQTTDHLSLTGGVEWYEDDVSYSSSEYAQEQRATESVYLNSVYNTGKLLSELALRHDKIEAIDNVNTFNASLGYRFDNKITISANRSKGFKAPTFNDLYYPWGGNPDLQAEYSYNNEFNLKMIRKDYRLAVSFYEMDITNLIQWTPDNTGAWSPQNVNEASISGREVSLDVTHADLKHTVTATYIEAENSATGMQLDRRARHQGSYEVSTQYDVVNGFVRAKYNGSRTDGGTKLPSFVKVDMGLSYSFNTQLDFQLTVKDAFDEAGVTVNNYFAPGREVYFTATYRN